MQTKTTQKKSKKEDNVYKYTHNELMEALNHIEELADIGADGAEDSEKSDLMKSYNYIASFINKYAKK